MMATPPGWYDDGHGTLRWWDGAQWTAHVHTPDAVAAPPAAAAPVALPPAAPVAAPVALPPAAAPVAQPPASPVVPPAEPVIAEQVAGAPVGYPGGGGVFSDAAEPRKSKLWILWVVLGVVVLGLIILAFVLIPLVIGWVAGSGATGANARENAAVSSVKTYDQAWATADCDKFMAVTTDSFRSRLQITDCAAFTKASNDFTAATDNYVLTIDTVQATGTSFSIDTTESYTNVTDSSGAKLSTPQPGVDHYTYIVVPVGSNWAIDSVTSTTGTN